MADQQLQMPSFLGQSMAGSRPNDPVADYLGGNASQSALQMIANLLLSGGLGVGSGALAVGGNPIAAAPMAALAVDRFGAAGRTSDDASRYIDGVRGFDNSGLPSGPQTPGRFAMPGLLSD